MQTIKGTYGSREGTINAAGAARILTYTVINTFQLLVQLVEAAKQLFFHSRLRTLTLLNLIFDHSLQRNV